MTTPALEPEASEDCPAQVLAMATDFAQRMVKVLQRTSPNPWADHARIELGARRLLLDSLILSLKGYDNETKALGLIREIISTNDDEEEAQCWEALGDLGYGAAQ